jgi:hypothetical protein
MHQAAVDRKCCPCATKLSTPLHPSAAGSEQETRVRAAEVQTWAAVHALAGSGGLRPAAQTLGPQGCRSSARSAEHAGRRRRSCSWPWARASRRRRRSGARGARSARSTRRGGRATRPTTRPRPAPSPSARPRTLSQRRLTRSQQLPCLGRVCWGLGDEWDGKIVLQGRA